MFNNRYSIELTEEEYDDLITLLKADNAPTVLDLIRDKTIDRLCPWCNDIIYNAHACPGPDKKVPESKFDVVLIAAGQRKILAIKAIREILGLDLKGAKDFVESAPKVIKTKISKSDAKYIKEKLSDIGAIVKINLR